ncbi:MAG: type II toxin-antitoxin system VapC family toxin [Chloroflexi bacterium]|nr:type II toxin-antitoxin system VapC family toxin [Chloroflexota bacterium]
MTATERGFLADAPPQRLYLDIDVIIAALVATEPHHVRCKAFLQRVQHLGLTTLYLSSYSWIEYLHVVSRKSFRDRLDPVLRTHLSVDRWIERGVREAYVRYFASLLTDTLQAFAWVSVAVNTAVAVQAIEEMAEHNLAGGDATHLGAMQVSGVHDLASLDAQYRRVDWLYLWNDHIHDTQSSATSPAGRPSS